MKADKGDWVLQTTDGVTLVQVKPIEHAQQANTFNSDNPALRLSPEKDPFDKKPPTCEELAPRFVYLFTRYLTVVDGGVRIFFPESVDISDEDWHNNHIYITRVSDDPDPTGRYIGGSVYRKNLSPAQAIEYMEGCAGVAVNWNDTLNGEHGVSIEISNAYVR